MASKTKTFIEPQHEEIAMYAYYLWEFEGRPHGKDKEHWEQARAHLIADRQYEAGVLKPAPVEASVISAKPAPSQSTIGKIMPASIPARARKPIIRPARPILARELVPA